jgi:hypothetical protein
MAEGGCGAQEYFGMGNLGDPGAEQGWESGTSTHHRELGRRDLKIL